MELRQARVARRRRVVAFGTLFVSLMLVAALPPASARPVMTTSGVRCTIVGTAGADVLVGTPHRDVICGRGGSDVIRGRGGDDVIDGGAGDDRMSGGPGSDTVIGGSGADIVSGDAGNDDLRGGRGADRVSGRAGADHANGETGDDVVSGDAGDDDLSGGPGSDVVDGGAGFNLCDVASEAGDQQLRCATDASKPVVEDVTLSRTTIDVSTSAQTVRIKAHVTDDTGVKSVQIGNSASLESGTPRDGIWVTTARIPRFVAPGPRDIDVIVRDRVGRDTFDTRADAFVIVNTVYDREMPALQSLILSASSLDVRTSAQRITANVHVTDDLAGPTDVYLCPSHAMPSGLPTFRQAGACALMSQTSGTATDSRWKASLEIPKGAPSGTWNVAVWISDAAGNRANDFWLGPDELAAVDTTHEPRYRAIPDGAGAFTVLGSTADAHAPVLTSLNLSPATVDTSSGAVQVTAHIAGTDLEGITGASLFISGYAGYPNNPNWIDTVQIAWVQDFVRVSGTPQNGVWRATFVVPGGTPNGTYWLQAVLMDTAHFQSWVSDDSPWTYDTAVLDDSLAPSGDHFVVANSG